MVASLHRLGGTGHDAKHFTNQVVTSLFQRRDFVFFPYAVDSTVVHGRYEMPSLSEHGTDRFQGFLSCRHRHRLVPDGTRRTYQGVEQARISCQPDDLFKFIRPKPTALFIKMEFLLQRIGFNNHGKSKGSYPAFVVASGAVKRVTQ